MDAPALHQYRVAVQQAEQMLARALSDVERQLDNVRDGRNAWDALAYEVATGAQAAATLAALREVSYLTEESS
jgi:hypothetical protein